ncbi:MAG: hypothetical protein ABSE57_10135 [Bryobacteraceae bacterium]
MASAMGGYLACIACIGWVKESDLFLEPAASYQVAQRIAGAERLPIGARTYAIGGENTVFMTTFSRNDAPRARSIWPGVKITLANLDRSADHIVDFSLAYLRQAGDLQRQAAKAARRRNGKR